MTVSVRPFDEALLRRAFDAARCAREVGGHPFRAVLADDEGNLLMDGVGAGEDGFVGRRQAATPLRNPITQSDLADVRGPVA